MVLKELKTKAVKQFATMFNTDKCRTSCITINNTSHSNVSFVEIYDNFVLLNRQTIDSGIITLCCIMIDDVIEMSYVTRNLNRVSFDNIEL